MTDGSDFTIGLIQELQQGYRHLGSSCEAAGGANCSSEVGTQKQTGAMGKDAPPESKGGNSTDNLVTVLTLCPSLQMQKRVHDCGFQSKRMRFAPNPLTRTPLLTVISPDQAQAHLGWKR